MIDNLNEIKLFNLQEIDIEYFDLEKLQLKPGVKELPVSPKDYTVARLSHPDAAPKIPIDTSMPFFIQPDIPYYTILNNQGGTGKCVAYSGIDCLCALFFYEYGEVISFSPDFYYSNRLPGEMNYSLGPNEGMYPEESYMHLVKDGCCLEQSLKIQRYADIKTNPDVRPYWDPTLITNAMREEAKKYRIGGWYRIPTTATTELKEALITKKVLTISIPILEGFHTGYNVITQYDYNTKKSSGTHRVRIVGFEIMNNTLFLICKNSWGEWAKHGLFRISADSYGISDAIAMTLQEIPHWADESFNYLLQKGIDIPAKDYEEPCTRDMAIEMVALTLGSENYSLKDWNRTEMIDRHFKWCNENNPAGKDPMWTTKDYTGKFTRGQTMAIVAKMYGWTEAKAKKYPPKTHWAQTFFDYLNANGIIIHMKEFDRQIKRGELMVFLAKFKGWVPQPK